MKSVYCCSAFSWWKNQSGKGMTSAINYLLSWQAVVELLTQRKMLNIHCSDDVLQTPSAGLRHPSFNHCHCWLHHSREKLSADEQFFDDAQMAVSL